MRNEEDLQKWLFIASLILMAGIVFFLSASAVTYLASAFF